MSVEPAHAKIRRTAYASTASPRCARSSALPRAAQVQTTVEQRVAAGDTVATRYALRDTASGETIGFALDMLRVKDGQIVEHWGLPLPPRLVTGPAGGVS